MKKIKNIAKKIDDFIPSNGPKPIEAPCQHRYTVVIEWEAKLDSNVLQGLVAKKLKCEFCPSVQEL